MATNAKRKNLEHLDPSEVEVMRDKIRKLEATLDITVKAKDEKEKELMAKIEELQLFKNDQVDHENDESQVNEVLDILFVFMDNNGLKGIAFKIFSFLDCNSFVHCRQVCRSWKNFIDNEWPMLQQQIFHLKRHTKDIRAYVIQLKFEPLIKIMEKSTNKTKLRVFINMCQELASKRCHKLLDEPLQYMIDHHRHEELEILVNYPIQKTISDHTSSGRYRERIWSHVSYHFTTIFKYACQYGCEICVKLFLDRSEEMAIDFNSVEYKHSYYDPYDDRYEFDHCLHVATFGPNVKEILDLLLRNAEEKGIDINFKNYHFRGNDGITLRNYIIRDIVDDDGEIEDYTEETYKILKINPSVDLKRSQ